MVQEIALTVEYLYSLANKQSLYGEWPALKQYAQELGKSTRTNCCGTKDVKLDIIEKIKMFIISMPAPDRQRLKEQLGLPSTAVFKTYTLKGRKSELLRL